MKKPVFLKPEFVMSAQEIAAYNALPDNMPDAKLTAKQIELVNDLYRRYIGQTIDNQTWSREMYRTEQGEKWPSGPRVKSHEAKRFILGNLVYINSKPRLTVKEACLKFYSVIECRPMYSKLVKLAYNVDNVR